MTTLQRWLLLLLGLVAGAGRAIGAENIGVTSGVTNDVTGTVNGDRRALRTGDGIFQDETIDTAKDSTAQLLFTDETSLTVGPESSITLDRFVYDPTTNTGKVVLNFAKGVARFITGSADPKSYEIRTPVATMGVRGTTISFFYDPLTETLTVVCEEGTCVVGGCTASAGQACIVTPSGVIGPESAEKVRWTGLGPVQWPLFFWTLETEGDQFDFPYTGGTQDLIESIEEVILEEIQEYSGGGGPT